MRGEFVDLSGARLYYYAAGTRGAGDPILLVHGFPTSSHLWADVVPRLPAGHRVVVVDLLGFGRSDPPRGQPLGIRAHADRLIELCDALGIQRACVVGHDLGGGIAQWMAIRYAERVSHLCLVDSVAFDAWPTRDVKLARATIPLTRHLPAGWLHSILRIDLARGYQDAERGTRSAELYVRPFATVEGRDAFMEHLLALDASESQAFAARLRDIVAPTAIVWGGQDPFLPAEIGRRLHDAIPGSTLLVLPTMRHFLPEEAPGDVADVVTTLLRR